MSCNEKNVSTNERKILRKQKKLQHMILSETGIIPSNYPEKNIVICNAGLATELKEQDLLAAFEEFGSVERLIMLPAKSYCFIIFTDLESAVKAYTGIHGATSLAQGGHPLYLSYIPKVPWSRDSDEVKLPDGLRLYEDFVTPEEEALLLSCVNWEEQVTTGSMKHRRVKHFGYEFKYSNNNIDLNNPLEQNIPVQTDFLWERLKKVETGFTAPPDQLTVNQYSPGQGIPSHVDTHSAFLSPILSLSLGATVSMEFRRGLERFSLPLPQRSLLVMDGAARYEWTHGIIPRAYDLINGRTRPRGERTSFTFRWVRQDADCRCSFPGQCDSQAQRISNECFTMEDSLAALIERQHVHQVYDKIASHFNETRSKIWTSVKNFVSSLPLGTLLVDIGCGNGKNLRISKHIMHLGIEYNGTLAEVAKYGENARTEEGDLGRIDVARANCLALPLKCNFADAVISIAVFHHLVSQERRIQAISEVVRILKPQGQALITVWAKDQARGEKTSYLKQSRKNRKQELNCDANDTVLQDIQCDDGTPLNITLPVHTNRTQFHHQDLLVPWKLKRNAPNNCEVFDDKESTFLRYYHVFDEGELQNVCKLVPRVRVIQSFYEQGNWCVILEKVS